MPIRLLKIILAGYFSSVSAYGVGPSLPQWQSDHRDCDDVSFRFHIPPSTNKVYKNGITHPSRREIMRQYFSLSLSALVTSPASAMVTDETKSLTSPNMDESYNQQRTFDFPSTHFKNSVSDEVTFIITKSDLQTLQGGLGLELKDVSSQSSSRIIVKSVVPNSLAERLGIQPSWILVSVNGGDAERTNSAGAAIYFSRAVKSVLNSPDTAGVTLSLTFRDPTKFISKIQNFPVSETENSELELPSVSTKIVPASEAIIDYQNDSERLGVSSMEQSNQVVTVTQLIPPKTCQRRATVDDLLEISYIGTIVENNAVFDGSAIKINGEAIPGRGNDVSIFFVLGKQPPGQFPAGWDVGLEGICVGERRRLIIPPVLAYGAAGVPRRGIPPNATLQYDITLISMNGVATPQ